MLPNNTFGNLLTCGAGIDRRTFLKRLFKAGVGSYITRSSFGFAQEGMASRQVKAVPRKTRSNQPFPSKFVDIGYRSGLTHPVVYGESDHKRVILETMGCGVAFIDYDNDGWQDIFVLCGTRLEGGVKDCSNRLYKNNRDGTFTDVTTDAGLLRSGWASSVTVGDYDNDGFEDIFVAYYGQNVLYRNNGNGSFTDVTERAGLMNNGKPTWSSGCTFLDYDRDGNLDLFVSHYVNLDLDEVQQPGSTLTCSYRGVPVHCGPRGLPVTTNRLYRNQGDGTFKDVTEVSGIASATPTYAMTAVAADFDEDGWTDIFVASDSTPNLLFVNQKDGTFKEVGIERGVALSDDGQEQANMGVAVGDFDRDGHLDIFATHFADDTPVLYRNSGKKDFVDATISAGLGVETRYVNWGTGFEDFDNDGWPDLFIVTGMVYPEVETRLPDHQFKGPRLLFRNLGNGQFEELLGEAGPALSEVHCSRGCAFGDFDNDGDVDIIIVNLNEQPSLLRNDVYGNGHWLKVQLIGTKSNRSAIGSRVIANYGGKPQARTVSGQSSYYSVNDRRLHFGLGAAISADLTIYWTNGLIEKFPDVAADALVTIKEGMGIIKTEKMAQRSEKAGKDCLLIDSACQKSTIDD